MKRAAATISLGVLCLSIACTSSSKMLEKRYYDGAVAKSVQVLLKKPDNQKEIDVLAKAYALANEGDMERIKFLKQSGEPQVWEEIFDRYNRLKSRQNLVKPLNLKIKKRINFIEVDYDQEIIEAKGKAADYLFAEGNDFLARNGRFNSRQAYDRFSRVKQYKPAYKGIDEKIEEAYAKSFSYVLFLIRNNSGKSLSHGFEEDMLKIGLQEQECKWIVFDTRSNPKTKYDFQVVLNIRTIEVTPEISTSTQSEETSEIEDGWEYVLDANGNVQKDSLGNDLKKTRYKTIRCSVTRFSLGKSATVGGTLDFMDYASGQMVKTDPIAAESKFNFVYAMVKGDKNALSEETRRLTTLRIAPFPSNEEMVLQTAENLKQHTKEIVLANQQLLQ